MKFLRICRDCGLEAFQDDDLKKFRKQKYTKYGYRNLCKKCRNERQTHKQYFLKLWGTSLFCRFCGEQIIKLKESGRNTLVIHSLDGNHDNWNDSNKVSTHRGCHTAYHTTGGKLSQETKDKMSRTRKGKKLSPEHRRNISLAKLGEKNSRWAGPLASEKIKYMRGWRQKRREIELKIA